ncbi:MAG TPA: hypothetical protein VNZ05_09715 [Solirubrobacteraceae bacterium]|nr:hypothetical protein [Solirubrobacteraceae bacterium]
MRRAGIALAGCLALGSSGASGALAETKTFAKQGCEKWEVPAGVSSVAMQATGAAGGPPEIGSAFPGKGDRFSALLSGLSSGENLFVCVDQAGGAGGEKETGHGGGPGGGASGVSRGANFETPVLVAAGGGGAGAGGVETFGAGGNAGEAGKDGQFTPSGGGAGTESEGGAGGAHPGHAGEAGTKFTGLGPGSGGAGGLGSGNPFGGGGGGGGYFGGGGGGGEDEGAAGGGGGGSDFCGNGVTSCIKSAQAGTSHEAGEAEGDAKVTLTYGVTCGKTTIGKFSDQLLANLKRVNRCTVPSNLKPASITELVIYLAPTSHSGSQTIRGVVYADSNGKPGSLMDISLPFTFTSKDPAGWYRLVFPEGGAHVAEGPCWIGVLTGATAKVAGERFDSVPKAEDFNSNSYTSGASNLFGSFKTTSEEMSLYAVIIERSL